MTNNEQQRLQNSLLNWYDIYGRTLPWRVKNGLGDPYKVWLSEIMLQQTTVATVQPYFKEFIKRWPSLNALAGAELDDVLHAWQGLGYYARARNLHKCARVVVMKYKGQLPDNEEDLRRLPGIGPYTAAAIAAIAYGRPSTPVDGNIVRVVSRLMNLRTPLPALHHEVTSLFALHVSKDRPGDFVQAMMDLGATICMPRKLMCDQCPWCQFCAAEKLGVAESLPVRAPKKKKPTRCGVVFWLENPGGEIFLRRRPDKGLLGGMMEFPSTDWRNKVWDVDDAIKEAPIKAKWQSLPGTVRHTFTHFHLELTVLSWRTGINKKDFGIWTLPEFFSDHALPTLMKKVAKHVRLTS